jgi:hypothetical protein
MSTKYFISTRDRMNSVRTAWEKAPAGPKKQAALMHYQAAEAALIDHNEADCLKSLAAATQALA